METKREDRAGEHLPIWRPIGNEDAPGFRPRQLPIPPMDTEILIGSYKRDEDTGKMVGTVLWVGKVTLVAGNGFLVTGRDKQRFCYPDEPFGGDETWTYANLLDEIDGLMRLPHEICFARAAYLKAQQEGGKHE